MELKERLQKGCIKLKNKKELIAAPNPPGAPPPPDDPILNTKDHEVDNKYNFKGVEWSNNSKKQKVVMPNENTFRELLNSKPR